MTKAKWNAPKNLQNKSPSALGTLDDDGLLGSVHHKNCLFFWGASNVSAFSAKRTKCNSNNSMCDTKSFQTHLLRASIADVMDTFFSLFVIRQLVKCNKLKVM